MVEPGPRPFGVMEWEKEAGGGGGRGWGGISPVTGSPKYDFMHAHDPTLFFLLTLFSLGVFQFLSQLEVGTFSS